MIQEKHRLLVDSWRAIEYAWEAASEKTRKPAKTAKKFLMVPHSRSIKITEDPTYMIRFRWTKTTHSRVLL